MKLTENFTLEELYASPTADRLGIDNTPSPLVRQNLRLLAEKILQPIRNEYKHPLTVTSGYRCAALNRAVNGAQPGLSVPTYPSYDTRRQDRGGTTHLGAWRCGRAQLDTHQPAHLREAQPGALLIQVTFVSFIFSFLPSALRRETWGGFSRLE